MPLVSKYNRLGCFETVGLVIQIYAADLELSLCLEAVPRLLKIAGSAVIGLLHTALCFDELLVNAGPECLHLFPLRLGGGLFATSELVILSLHWLLIRINFLVLDI